MHSRPAARRLLLPVTRQAETDNRDHRVEYGLTLQLLIPPPSTQFLLNVHSLFTCKSAKRLLDGPWRRVRYVVL